MVEPLNTKAWVMVPVQPTPEMVEAHYQAHAEAETVFADAQLVWAKMLAASPSLPVVDGWAFTHVAKNKLDSLLADGWRVNGYSIQKDDRLGLVTTGAFIGWYTNACEAMDAAESRVLSLEEEVKRLRGLIEEHGSAKLIRNALKVNSND